MTQKYRTNDNTKWGTGIGRNLTATEVDVNFWDISVRLGDLEALPPAPAGIDHFTTVGTQFTVTLTDTTILGPYDFPIPKYNDRGTWAPSTTYAVLDTFTINGGLYEVIFAHVSDVSFDPGANDGLGHDYYHLLIQTPGSSLPTGGATGQVMEKSSSVNYAVTWGWKLPAGIAVGKYLRGTSGTRDDAAWTEIPADEVAFTPITGSALTSSNVADALEELSAGGGSIAGLSDVEFASGDPMVGALFMWDGDLSKWTAVAEGGSVDDLLKFNGSTWDAFPMSSLSILTSQLSGPLSTSQLRNPTITALGTSGSVSLNPALGDVFTVTPTGDITLTMASTPLGAELTLIVTTAGTTSWNITFSGIKSQGVLATGTVNAKSFVVRFVSDGITVYETSRTTAM